MPWGIHKGTALANVPAGYLLHFYENAMLEGKARLPLKEYVEDNLEVLKQQRDQDSRSFDHRPVTPGCSSRFTRF